MQLKLCGFIIAGHAWRGHASRRIKYRECGTVEDKIQLFRMVVSCRSKYREVVF